jgi:hypothetical protein
VSLDDMNEYEGVPKIFWTDAVKIINLNTKRVWKLSMSTQLRSTWHTDSLEMIKGKGHPIIGHQEPRGEVEV